MPFALCDFFSRGRLQLFLAHPRKHFQVPSFLLTHYRMSSHSTPIGRDSLTFFTEDISIEFN
jgi:hypothetical protein